MKPRKGADIINLDRLKETVSYCPITGQFTALMDRTRTRKGDILGSIHHTGYRIIWIDGKSYTAGRLAWFYMTGKWPEVTIDHKDCVKDNNAFDNLREATDSQNGANRKWATKYPKGVQYRDRPPRAPVWVAQINIAGRVTHLGHFKYMEHAAAAYRIAASTLHGEFARF